MNNYITSMRASDGNIVKLECHDALPSTARLIKEYAKINYPDRYVVFADGRKKTSEKGKSEIERGIFMSILLRPSIFPSQAGLLPALSAVALATALEEHTEEDIGIGWVSEIYCNGKSIGRVNLEGKLDSFNSYEYLIITFGAVLSEKEFPPRMTDLIKTVFEEDRASVLLVIAKNILNKFFKLYGELKSPAKFMEAYSKKFILRGNTAKLVSDGKRERCKILGINTQTSALVVENSKKKVVEISTGNNVIIPKKVKLK